MQRSSEQSFVHFCDARFAHMLDVSSKFGVVSLQGNDVVSAKFKQNVELDPGASFVTVMDKVVICGYLDGKFYYITKAGKPIPFINEDNQEDSTQLNPWNDAKDMDTASSALTLGSIGRQITTMKLMSDTELWIGYSDGNINIFRFREPHRNCAEQDKKQEKKKEEANEDDILLESDEPECVLSDILMGHKSPVMFIGKMNDVVYTVSSDGIMCGWNPESKDQVKLGAICGNVLSCAFYNDYILVLCDDRLVVASQECINLGHYDINNGKLIRATEDLFVVLLESDELIVGRFNDEDTETQVLKLPEENIIDFLPEFKKTTGKLMVHYITSEGAKKNPNLTIKGFTKDIVFISKFSQPSYEKALQLENIRACKDNSFSPLLLASSKPSRSITE